MIQETEVETEIDSALLTLKRILLAEADADAEADALLMLTQIQKLITNHETELGCRTELGTLMLTQC